LLRIDDKVNIRHNSGNFFKKDLAMNGAKKSLLLSQKFLKLIATTTTIIFTLGVSSLANATTTQTTTHTHHVHHHYHHAHKTPAKHHRLASHKSKRSHHPEKTLSEDSPAMFAAAHVPAYLHKPDYQNIFAANTTPAVAMHQKHLVNFVDKTVSTLHYSDYKLGGKKFDPLHGVYVLDCSNFVDHILQTVSPNAFSTLVNATGADSPSTQHYYDFFTELNSNTDSGNFWNKINSVEQLRPGDILVFRYKNSRGNATGGGHVMVVMDTPTNDSNVFFVRVADSAPSRHSQDTRQIHEGGIGIGTLLLKVNPITGRPNAYAWGMGGYWNKNVNFAMARPLDTSGITGV
jgi:cell wall-associated NlpC family hydrolase